MKNSTGFAPLFLQMALAIGLILQVSDRLGWLVPGFGVAASFQYPVFVFAGAAMVLAGLPIYKWSQEDRKVIFWRKLMGAAMVLTLLFLCVPGRLTRLAGEGTTNRQQPKTVSVCRSRPVYPETRNTTKYITRSRKKS